MKVYRIIGSVFSAIISLVLVVVLLATLISAGVCAVVSEDTIDKLTATLVKDEQVQTITKETLKSFNIGRDSATFPEETVDEFLKSEAVQKNLSKLISETVTSILKDSGEEADASATVIELINAEPELVNDMLEQLLITEEATYDDAFEMLTGVEITEGVEIPTVIENPLGEEYPPITIPAYGASLSELASLWVAQNPEAVNEAIRKYVAEGFSLGDLSGYLGGETIDYVLGEDGEVPEIPDGYYGITSVDSDDEFVTVPGISLLGNDSPTDAIIDISRLLLNISPVVLLVVGFAILAVLYLLTALLTWSLRTPLSFTGVVSILGGVLTLLLSFIPVLSFVSSASDQLPEVAVTAIELIWTALQTKLLLYGLLFVGVGVVLIALFILFSLLKKKKAALAK